MATTKGATPLSEAEFVDEIVNRSGLPKSTVRQVVKALKEEAIDCLTNGYKVTLSGLITLTPAAKAGRKKGTVVRNPFDGSTKTLRADEQPKFKIKAKASPAVVKGFPSVKSADGTALVKKLTPAKKK